ncbi:MAG TPA: hypothetical protein VFV78_14945 [Vicinamibacterales bacterium]|nr:hypothetical protein [Vicinamibacterales bacterium]
MPGLRSLHLRAVTTTRRTVARPVRLVFYRPTTPIEIIRVLHERIDPEFHILR